MSDIRACECCGNVEEVRVASSGICAMSFAYCNSCLADGIEPYGAVVSSVWSIGSWAELHPVVQNDYLCIIHFHDKTFEDLKADVAKLDADYIADMAREAADCDDPKDLTNDDYVDSFYEDHGCCKHCYFVGEDATMCECPKEEVAE